MAGERKRGGGDERFYCPPAMRGMYNQQKQRYNQQQQKVQSNGNVGGDRRGSSRKEKLRGGVKDSSNKRIGLFDDGASETTTTVSENSNNLDRFLEYCTPAVIAQEFPKTSMKGWRNSNEEFHPHYILGDLWECLGEWSAYGVGVPLLLNGSDSVVQYYVPYLSGIQLYIDPSSPFVGKKKHDESDVDSSRETSSNGSCEAGPDRGSNGIRGTQTNDNSMGAAIQRLDSLSLRDDHLLEPSVGDSDVSNPNGVLVFEFLEEEKPFFRRPLTDKISSLASIFPEIKSLRSCDLTPASWLSVAWYPIYRIPIGKTLNNVEACFLTFHSLSTPLKSTNGHSPHQPAPTMCKSVHEDGMPMKLLVPAFGLSSYKFNVSVWDPDEDYQKLKSLVQVAGNWLRLLQVNHPDYNFFLNRMSFR